MSNVFFRFKQFQHPVVYLFKDPDTGYEYKEDTLSALYNRIIGYRQQNELKPIEELELVVENYLCRLPCHNGMCTTRELKRSIYGYIRGGVSLLTNLFYGEENMVSQKTADARAEICVKCPLNVFPDKKGFLKWSDRIAEASTNGKRSAYHNLLGNCEGCSCTLKAKVFLNGQMNLNKLDAMKMLEANPKCWQLK